jgi:hypothetical protein
MILIKYKEFNKIEGYTENEKDFDNWLMKHNRRRRQEGEVEENKEEFELIELNKLN